MNKGSLPDLSFLIAKNFFAIYKILPKIYRGAFLNKMGAPLETMAGKI
jgi:hypothetical protein